MKFIYEYFSKDLCQETFQSWTRPINLPGSMQLSSVTSQTHIYTSLTENLLLIKTNSKENTNAKIKIV